MRVSEALLIAAAVTILYIYFVGDKIIEIDITGLLPKNWKSRKLKRLLTQCSTPLQGAGLHGDIRKTFEKILIPLKKLDKKMLPERMDMNFRQKIERQIDQLERQKLYRDIRLTDIVPLPKNDFKRWNDDGREWREALLQCSALERFIPKGGSKPVHEIYRKTAYLRVLQSRHIRHSDRIKEKKNYYDDKINISCPSCGAEVKLTSQQTVCPYCGGVIQSDFYDWQTEAFEIYEKIGTNLQKTLLLLKSAVVLYICLFLCLWLIRDVQISLVAGVGTSMLVLAVIIVITFRKRIKHEKLKGKIVRFSENYLRTCINEALYEKINHANLMDYSIGTIFLEKVVNTEDTTQITVQVYISETYLFDEKKTHTKNYKRTLTFQRARYPERRKEDGNFFIEKDCPSCGANFIPDENNCCSFCGYSLQVNNSKWKIQINKD